MTESNSWKESQEEGIWPGRYLVKAKVKAWSHNGVIYRNVGLKLFRADMEEDEIRSLLEPLGFKPDKEDTEYLYLMSYAEDTFSEEQADKLIAYLEGHDGTQAWKEPAEKPEPNDPEDEDNVIRWAGISAIVSGMRQGHYPLYKEDSYNLDFKAEAYYDTRDIEPTPEDNLLDYIEEAISAMDIEELQELKEYLDQKRNNKFGGLMTEEELDTFMNGDFISQSGDSINFNNIAWSEILYEAVKRGWKPAGDLVVADYSMAKGSRIILDQDAHSLASVLEEALQDGAWSESIRIRIPILISMLQEGETSIDWNPIP